MAVDTHKTYKCDKCNKEHDTKHDGALRGWFKLTVKCHYGCDEIDKHEFHVCGFKCAYEKMASFQSVHWVKLDAVDF